MKHLAALLLCAASLYAADTPVLIQDTLNLQQAVGWNGVITVSWPSPFTAAGGTQVGKGSRDITVTDGALSISLYSTEGASPSFLYTVRYRSTDAANRGLTWTETWYVPASGPVTLADVRRSSTVGIGITYRGPYGGRPTHPFLHDLALFTDATAAGVCATSGGTHYALCAWDGSAWVPTSLASGGGGAQSWATLTSSTWASLTSSTWSNLIQ